MPLRVIACRQHPVADLLDAGERFERRRHVVVGAHQQHWRRARAGSERADGGTLLLDEVGQLPHAAQDAEEPHLRGVRQLADLVEEQRPAVGALEPALARRDRAGERAALVAEQLAVDQLGRDRAAVDAHHRSVAAPRAIVERARDQLLARSGLAEEQHRHVGARDLLEPLHHAAQAAALADDRLDQAAAVQPAQQRLVLGERRLAQPRELVHAAIVRQRAPRTARRSSTRARRALRGNPRPANSASTPAGSPSSWSGATITSRPSRGAPKSAASTSRAQARTPPARAIWSTRARSAGGELERLEQTGEPVAFERDGLEARARDVEAPDRDRRDGKVARDHRQHARQRLLHLQVPAASRQISSSSDMVRAPSARAVPNHGPENSTAGAHPVTYHGVYP